MARLLSIISAILLLAAFALPAVAEAGHRRGGASANVAKRSHAGHHRDGRHPHGARAHHKRDHRHRHQHRKSTLRSAHKAQNDVRGAQTLRSAHKAQNDVRGAQTLRSAHKAQNDVRGAHRAARTHHRSAASGNASKRRVRTQTSGAGTCPGEGLTPTASDLPQIREATLCLVNKQRMIHGLTPLKDAPKLDASAEAHTASMIEDGYFGHYGPDGDTPVDRMKASGYIYSSRIGYAIGENIAWGTLGLGTPRAIVEAWMASPGHRENILSARFRESGIGVLPALPGSLGSGQPGATYTQDFGVIVTG